MQVRSLPLKATIQRGRYRRPERPTRRGSQDGREVADSRRPDNPIEALILTRQPEIPAGLLNRVRSIRGHNGGATAEYRRVPRD